MTPGFTSLFQSSATLYIPIGVVIAFALLFIPSMMVPGAKAEGVAKAITSYLLKTLGLVLITLSGVQLTYGLITMQMPTFPLLSALTLIFAVGLGLMIHESRVLKDKVDEASMMVVRLVFCHSCEVIGAIISIVSALSLMLTFILTQKTTNWELPGTMLLLGLILMLASSIHIAHKTKRTTKPVKAVAKKK